ncbi:hypothetical protein BCD67_02650 [Oscillatoriales cyanobacterium USR001]|nr:hypothetical protein BCD67_02650 [Oscillatoriales cyanobacterium USR001]
MTVGGTLNAVTTNGRKIFFDNLQLVKLNDYTNDYSLSFRVPFWHRDIKLTLWEYIAELDTTVEEAIEDVQDVNKVRFDRVDLQLQEIESKVDSLL